jgi:hydroxypyruvate isomerase
MEHIAHFHIAGAPGRHEVDDTQEVNYRGVVSAIAKTGFSGYIGHEYVPLGDPLKALRDAFRLCDV